MYIQWPNNLVEEIAYRRVVLFLGAGVSALATNDLGEHPKTWGAFLSDAIALLDHASPAEFDFINSMIAKENYLLALQSIQDKCDPGRYRHYLEKIFRRPNFKPSESHQKIKELDCKVVVTTNFDKIYDNLCNEHGYSVSTYMTPRMIISNLKTTNNLIIKAHGSIDDIDNMVFTQSQYYQARTKYPNFYDVLRSLFLTNTVLFLGYSLSDPDINLVLETLTSVNTLGCPHYAVVKKGVPKELKDYWLKSFNIACLEYGPNFDNLPENIESLLTEVLSYRATKRIP